MSVRVIIGDVREKLRELPDESVHCVVTSPPYFGLRDYGVAGQIGLEPTPAEFTQVMVEVFREVRRVLRKDGTCWINLGDSYAGGYTANGARPGNPEKNGGVSNRNGLGTVGGLKAKDLIGIPWRVAFALQADGWYLRQDIIWSKPNPMPESVTDRCTKAHEYLFLLSRSPRYHYDAEAIAEAVTESTVERLTQPNLDNQAGSDRVPGKTNGAMKAVGSLRKADSENGSMVPGASAHGGIHRAGTPRDAIGTRNRRSVWTVATQPFKEAHFATFPPDLIEPCIKAGCPKDCCAKCGAPWIRQINRGPIVPADGWKFHAPERGSASDGMDQGSNRYRDGHVPGHRTSETIGWAPSCSCKPGIICPEDPEFMTPVRGTVLDPFGGAGTTGLVADRLQRDAILIELNPEYMTMAKERIIDDAPLFAVLT